MKIELMRHQKEALQRFSHREYWANFSEQGTGKTLTLLADAARLYFQGEIEGVLVIAPNGVHENWSRIEIPKALDAPYLTGVWRSGMKDSDVRKLWNRLLDFDATEQRPLRFFLISYDALITKKGFAAADKFLDTMRCEIIADESHRFKNPTTATARCMMALRPKASYVRIATGTPMTNEPTDVFSQFEFMESGLLGTTSFRAFKARYAELLDGSDYVFRKMVEKNPRVVHAQIVKKDERGQPIWRDLDKLHELIYQHAFRVEKKDCLDLPEKLYTTRYFELSPLQRATYNRLFEERRLDLASGDVETFDKLAVLSKLRQVTSGFILLKDDKAILEDADGRLECLMDIIESTNGQIIVFAHFNEEIRKIAERLTEAGERFATYYGPTSAEDRRKAIDDFQNGDIRIFLGNPAAAGTGLTLTAANTVVYYSNDFSLLNRQQSEDRAHRIGQRNNVLYIDIVATETIDEAIADALQRKTDLIEKIIAVTRKTSDNS